MEKKVVNGVFACAFDAEKVKAMRTYAEQKGIDLDAEITKILERKYIQIVPKPVREYIDFSSTAQLPQQRTAKSTRKQRRFLRRISRKAVKILPQKMLNLPQILRLTAILQLRNIQRALPLRSRPRGVFGDMQRSARITASSL